MALLGDGGTFKKWDLERGFLVIQEHTLEEDVGSPVPS
jgi:hypothetical protein